MANPSQPGPPDEDFFMAALWDAARPVAIEVSGYTILGEISRGGMGVVYHARQTRPEREVALKVLLPEFAENSEMLARFQLEARAMATLDHPGILPVYEVGEAEGSPFFSMKLASGGSLSERLLRGAMPPKEAAILMIELSRALHHAHQHGVLHRDLKPGNFLFLEDGRACVSDFGLAKLSVPDHGPLTRTESFFGTPHYMPPEVAAGSAGNATVAGDLYSMGAVFYECLTGRRPHDSGKNIAALLRSISDDPVIHPAGVKAGLPRDLSIVCMKALERNPANRYATLEDFAADIERWLHGHAITARPVGPLEAAWRWAGRHPLPAALLAILLTVIVVGSTLLAVSYHQRGVALQRSLVDQARSERLLGAPGHRERALTQLRQATAISKLPEIRDEAAALLSRPDLSQGSTPIPSAAEQPPRDVVPDDPITERQHLAGGNWTLTFHESGAARLWEMDMTQPRREWHPQPGREIVGGFVPGSDAVALAETERGAIIEPLTSNMTGKILAPPGPMVRFLSTDPAGKNVCLAGENGIEVRSLENPNTWQWQAGQARCAAVFSADGSRLAAASGDRREVAVLAAATGAVCATIPVSGIPQSLALGAGGALLAVACDDGTIGIYDSATGHQWCAFPFQAQKLDFPKPGQLTATDASGRKHSWAVESALALHPWAETARAKADGSVSDMAVSPDGLHLLTISSGCLGIWSVKDERQTGYHLLENQRIDVQTSAWWLGNSEILLQVPGSIERLPVAANGVPGMAQRLPKIPGSTVIQIAADGGWIVRVTDEDGNKTFERWPAGDAGLAQAAEPPPGPPLQISAGSSAGGISATLDAAGCIEVRRADGSVTRLTPPQELGIRALRFSQDGARLIILTRLHQLFSWNLAELGAALDELGL